MKAMIRIGYTEYVMEVEQAVKLAEVLMRAEKFRKRGWGKEASYYVWTDAEDIVTPELTMIPDDLYNMAKLAGQPPKD